MRVEHSFTSLVELQFLPVPPGVHVRPDRVPLKDPSLPSLHMQCLGDLQDTGEFILIQPYHTPLANLLSQYQ